MLARTAPVYRRTVEEHFLPHLGDDVEALHESLVRVAESAHQACPADTSPAPAEPSSAPRP
jgi:hypothetical protein